MKPDLRQSTCLIIASLLLLALSLAGCGAKQTAAEPPPLVRSMVVTMNGNGQNALYSGEVKGRYESQLAFQVSGRILRRHVELGHRVQPGDVLMEIDPKDVRQSAAITAAQLYSAKSQLTLAENNLKRYQELFEQNAISRAQYEQFVTAHAAAEAAVRAAAAQNVQGANQLGYTELRATSPGVISSINVEAGQVVAAGQTALTLVQDGEREVEIDVPENRYKEISNVPAIKITFWALPDRVVNGSVREISPMADKVSRTYKVRITLHNPPPEVNLGMTASVATALSAGQKSAYIPLSAIYQTDGTPAVWIAANGAVTLRTVTLGAFGDNSVQVVGGLQTGETIVTAGVHKLKEGQKVRLAGGSQ